LCQELVGDIQKIRNKIHTKFSTDEIKDLDPKCNNNIKYLELDQRKIVNSHENIKKLNQNNDEIRKISNSSDKIYKST